MPVTCTHENHTLTAAISGDLDHHGARAVMTALTREIDRNLPQRLVLDCSGITFMDSSGIAVLLRAYQQMRRLEGEVRARGVPRQAGKVLKTAGLDRLIILE